MGPGQLGKPPSVKEGGSANQGDVADTNAPEAGTRAPLLHFPTPHSSPCCPVQLETLVLNDNNLTGPAFPPAWLQPGSMRALQTLQLNGNERLAGTLPASLSWPALQTL